MDNAYLIALLRAAVNDTVPEKPDDNTDWRALYMLAEKHSVTATACYALSKLPKEYQPQGNEQAAFKKKMQMALGIESMQHYEISQVMKAFEDNGIQYAPLKGWILKGLYAVPYIRTMCDVDIVVNDYDMTRVEPILTALGFEKENDGGNHDGYIKSGKISTEIHRALFVSSSPYYGFFADIMKRAAADDDKGIKRHLTKEDFFLHLLAHLAKHFDGSGTGMRSFMDIYVYTKKYGNELDRNYIEAGLCELGLRKFAEIICDASYTWFSEDEKYDRDKYSELMKYVLYTGTYGSKDASIVSGIEKNNGSKAGYLMGRFFPERTLMEWQFPILKKRPYLIFFCYIIRGFKCVLFKRDVVRNEFKKVKEVNEEAVKNIEDIRRICGLK